jgi:hypothetical protein
MPDGDEDYAGLCSLSHGNHVNLPASAAGDGTHSLSSASNL